ncbi:hypothetical protein SERLADRAFT_456296 [Serpula lacrymans var. lacrymans S7.9]|uniref:Uncharacterized protein n=1 Tax=Serpula lacrymans var. lacrymans (strain S7.9) TaxID=578457 RepID=F8NI80_SERL9|nr:uncharacterized protein SERLADRAFT_456296 [Serpula lacrymans var. lacrymans S7.9]EGO28977.1 hypothetical protein SERLADRAFT_456296 [Serpula lacrymans var. lacrymans S7.9]
MAWYSSKQQKINLMERNIRSYNISDPLQAYEFSVTCGASSISEAKLMHLHTGLIWLSQKNRSASQSNVYRLIYHYW